MDLKDTIIKQLSAPVKRKGTQEYMTDEDGNIVTSEAAIGMTIVQKALSGDLQAVAFVLNLQMQQQRDPKTEAEEADRRRQQTEQNRDQIRRTLQADNLWTDSLALDLDELAQQKTFIDRLTEQMNQPGYQDTFTIPRKDGTMMPTINPCTNTATRPWRSSSRAWNASVPRPSSASCKQGSLSDEHEL